MTSLFPGTSAPAPPNLRVRTLAGEPGAPATSAAAAAESPTAPDPVDVVTQADTATGTTASLAALDWADLRELAKPRITVMVAVTAAAGYALGAHGGVQIGPLVALIVGTSALSAGASALNQVVERETDARMIRTRARPVAAGRMAPMAGVAVGVIWALFGALVLAAGTNPLTTLLGAVTLLLYVAVYTPLKRVTSLCTIVGAVPGALPPLMGWTAATDRASIEGWVLFAILFLWQMPHFLAIAWLYREDYARGGQPMLPVIDEDGSATARQIVVYCIALLPATVLPWVLQLSGPVYLWGALGLGLLYLAAGVRAAQDLTSATARSLLRVSVLYLPLLLALMTLDRPGS